MMNASADAPAGDVSVIVPAAGSGERMGAGPRKPYLTVGGEPILLRTCRRLHELTDVFEIVVVAHPGDIDQIQQELWTDLHAVGVELIVPGGQTRAQSVWNGLEVVSAKAEVVAVHDAVRPFFSLDTMRALVSTARRRGAAVPVSPFLDTPKRLEGDKILETVRRAGLVRTGTPQVFRSDLLIEAYEYRMRTGELSDRITDDSQLVEAMGAEVAAVLDGDFNIKITSPTDLRLAEALLAAGLVE
ncbi:MAG: 2-C-methyl-D-erythritol 4-phosphate cytidylyltransferase [Planctomycetes bacterium]|nr:2-C-methyl-D-erythritol 4-phosphate cytidylyltransferase [Planctomycetota bacterium]